MPRLSRKNKEGGEINNYDHSGRKLNIILGALLMILIIERALLSFPPSSTTTTSQEKKEDISHFQPALGDGFHPIYIYSNPQTAESEIPRKDTQNHGQLYSQVDQDVIVLALTKAIDIKNGNDHNNNKFFVDLASNDPIALSNTLNLEQEGWNGLCIEGNPQYWYGLGRYRKCIIVGGFVGGKVDGRQVDVALNNVFGGIVGDEFDNKDATETVKRDLVSIKTVFQKANVPEVIDYFSLDVEGAESLVMEDFPWNEYKFKFMTIERPKDDLRQMLKYHGYVFVQDLTDWGETLWVHKDSVDLSIDEIRDIVGLTARFTIQYQKV